MSLRTDLTDALPVLKRESHYAIYEAYSVVQVGLKVKGEEKKLDQGALGMSDPCGTLHSALKPYSVSRINCLLSNFYFCAY